MNDPQTDRDRRIDDEIGAWFRREADAGRSRVGDRVVREALARTAGTRQDRPRLVLGRAWGSGWVFGGPAGIGSATNAVGRLGTVVLVAALLTVAIIGAALAAGGGFRLLGTVVAPRPSQPVRPSVAPASAWPGWLRVDSASLGGGVIADAVAAGPGIVAVGTIEQGGHEIATIWDSPDGTTWRQVSSGPAFEDATANRIGTDEATLVVMGFDCPPAASQLTKSCGWPRIWRSADGLSWTSAVTDFRQCCGKDIVGYQGLVAAPPSHFQPAGAPRFVLVGVRSTVDTYGGQTVGAATATSNDGITWRLSGAMTPALAGGSMGGAAWGPAGLVGVGDRLGLPAFWASTDGLSWTPVQAKGNPALASINDITAGPNGYVIVGSDGGKAAVWSSPDGRTATEDTSGPGFDGAKMTRIILAPHGLVALGQTATGDGIAWVSSDGTVWLKVDTGDLLAGVRLTGTVAIGPRLLLFGTDATGAAVVAVGQP
jgi:hypothetical protein